MALDSQGLTSTMYFVADSVNWNSLAAPRSTEAPPEWSVRVASKTKATAQV